jgi:hypothetical protein
MTLKLSSRAVFMEIYSSIMGLMGNDHFFAQKNEWSWTGYTSLIHRISNMMSHAQGAAIGIR